MGAVEGLRVSRAHQETFWYTTASTLPLCLPYLIDPCQIGGGLLGMLGQQRIGVAGALGEGLQASGVQGPVPGSPSSIANIGIDTPPMELSIGALNYSIKGKKLLSDLTASFPPCTLTGIMGPSGCGKTILLNLMSGREKVGEFSGIRMVRFHISISCA
eukprot:SAG31_NODE_1984_length_6740_cov_4.949255_5_plen_159_part_00